MDSVVEDSHLSETVQNQFAGKPIISLGLRLVRLDFLIAVQQASALRPIVWANLSLLVA